MNRIYLVLIVMFLFSKSSHSQWLQTNGPERGRINNIYVDGARIYIATNCGVYYSDDKGDNWTPSFNGLTMYNPCREMDKMGDTLLLQNEFIKYSVDSGLTWQDFSAVPPASITHIEVSDTSIFACSFYGIFRTDDFGQSWVNLSSLFAPNTHFESLLKLGNTIFAGATTDLWKSTNNGNSWTSIMTTFNTVAPLTVSDNRMFIGKAYSSDCMSIDTAATFINITPSGIVGPGNYIARDSIFYSGFTTRGTHISYDLGLTWANADSNLYDTATVGFGSIDSTVFAANGRGGVFSTTFGDSIWTEKNYHLPLSQITVLSSYKNDLLAFSYEQKSDLFRSVDNGTNWISIKNNLPATISVNTILIEDTNYFLATQNFGVFRSSDRGATWNAINNGLTSNSVVDIARKGTRLFASQSTGGAVFISDDNGDTWTASSTGFQYSFAADFFVDYSRIYVKSGYNIYYSDNNGVSWDSIVRVGCPQGAGPDVINKVNGKLLALFHGSGLFMFDSLNGSWSEITNQFANDNCQDFVMLDSMIILAHATGVFISADEGTTWTSTNHLYIYDIAVGDSMLYAGSNGGGVWKINQLDLIGIPVGIEQTGVEENKSLNIFPNPTSGITTAQLNLPKSSSITIHIFDLLGREKTILVQSEKFNSGLNYISFDTSEFDDGVCVLQIILDYGIINRTFIISK